MPIRKLKGAQLSFQFGPEADTRDYDEAYFSYVEDLNPRRTQFIGKRAISGWKLIKLFEQAHLRLMIFIDK